MEEAKDAKTLFENLQKELSDAFNAEEKEFLARILIQEIAHLSWSEIIAGKQVNIQSAVFENPVQQLNDGRPWQYVLGRTEFAGIVVWLNESVLIPRPETEELTQIIALENPDKPLKVLDIGTGSGCIPIALLTHRPSWQITACDISEKALKTCHHNAMANRVPLHIIQWDVFTPPPSNDTYDIIISNPPYVLESDKAHMAKNVLEFEPHEALFVTDNNPLVYYRRIFELSSSLLNRDGRLYLEMHEEMGEPMKKLASDHGFEARIVPDFRGKSRFVKASFR